MTEDYNWYMIRTVSSNAEQIKSDIQIRLTKAGFEDYLKEMKTSHLQPGMIFINSILTNEIKEIILHTPKVIDFLGGSSPTILDELTLSKLLNEETYHKRAPTLSETYKKGTQVKVIDGPYKGFTGVISQVNDEKNSITVDVQVFGRTVSPELPIDHFE